MCLHVYLLICICAGAQVHDIFRNNVAMEQGLASMVEREGGGGGIRQWYKNQFFFMNSERVLQCKFFT